ncbi:transthyretin-like family protein [Aureliella helgolandensis]|uniref:Carboxypeptidase regulatory-like domain-containing protein n=1 Tax=Aureliella helgolandensis TaxID=2527968 RepID=A0A518GGV1_9BACT|nr:carboxypeptidase-like regulatory domain-containing protein [Aureliella helgolandensis]QDV27822.1 hypothetical protein Q31a_62150 [Aureliella helgolandensis]
MHSSISRVLFSLSVGTILGLSGCSNGLTPDYSKLGLLEVSGTVTLDGDPVAGAGVFFYEPDERYCYGITDASGRYTMMLNSEKSGVTPGEKRVEIYTSRNPLGAAAPGGDVEEEEEASMPLEEDPDGQTAKKKKSGELLPACYNADSKLQVEVTASDSAMDFELRSDCSTSTAS